MEFNGMPCKRSAGNGLWYSRIGLGLWKWGHPYDGSSVDFSTGHRLLDRALELGAFHWDTANAYNMQSGNSERLLGEYFAARGSAARDRVLLATKIFHPVRPAHVMEHAFTPNQRGGSRLYIRRAVEDCLARLRTDRIDLLYLHMPCVENGAYTSPLEETWGALDDLVTAGKVVYLAVSNHSAVHLREAMQALRSVAKDTSRRIVAVQNHYNLIDRARVSAAPDDPSAGEQDFLEYCTRESIDLIPYFPLAAGMLSGRYRRGAVQQTEGRIAREKYLEMFTGDRAFDIVEGLERLAAEAGMSLSQLALAWLLSRGPIPSVIAGVTSLDQLESNAAAARLTLSSDQLQRIDALTRLPSPAT